MNQKNTIKIQIEGIVQGVGFRPFIYNLAYAYSISGYVLNNSSGVEILAQGEGNNIEDFIKNITLKAPKLSVITSLKFETAQYSSDIKPGKFFIKESIGFIDKTALISPDISICNKCREELFDENDRRYKYPFINCTDCGPRYTIIENIPYDRKYTTMKSFPMCGRCNKEYEDPVDRRFHAQPDACFLCGPQIALYKANGKAIHGFSNDIFSTESMLTFNRERTEHIIRDAIELLKKGNILAIKGLGGFHLAVDAENDEAVGKLRNRKNRYEKPLAVMSLNFDKILSYTEIDDEEKLLLDSIQKPIVLLKKKKNNCLSKYIAPASDTFGVMLPYTPLHYLLLENNFIALVMTSGNFSDEPICKDNDEAFNTLADIADYFLIHNRDIHFRCDDSVVRYISSAENNNSSARIVIRRSRGFVPMPVFLKNNIPNILAIGAELKNTICLIRGKQAFLSQHIGDLENLETLNYFEETIERFTNILHISPDFIAYDMHPEYLNTKWLLESELSSEKEIIPVQHHHAHIASCMAENQIEEPVIGFAMDGTGLGLDSNIWGGEVLLTGYDSFERHSHFEYIPLPGGDLAVREPWRLGVGYLFHIFGDGIFKLDIPFLRNIENDRILTICQMIHRNFNTFKTSGLGRLFDVMAAIAGGKNKVSFEGQAAIEFENYLYNIKTVEKLFPYKFYLENNIIKTDIMIKSVIFDIMRNIGLPEISYKFHTGLIKILKDIALKIREEQGLNKVALSGGCFQNSFLLINLSDELKKLNFEVYSHRLVPSNDGGISLGQAVIAGYKALTLNR